MDNKKIVMICSILIVLLLVGCKQNAPISTEETTDAPSEPVEEEVTNTSNNEELTAKDILKGGADLKDAESENTGVLAVLDNSEPNGTSMWESYGYYGTLNEQERNKDESGRKGGFRRTLKNADVPEAPEIGS